MPAEKTQTIGLIIDESNDPKQPPLAWKFGNEIVRSPGEATDRIVRMAGERGLPACRLIDHDAVRKAQEAVIRHQREQVAEAYRDRIERMESDSGCPPELLKRERAEFEKVLEMLK